MIVSKSLLQKQIEDLLDEKIEYYVGDFTPEELAREICYLAFEYYREDLGR